MHKHVFASFEAPCSAKGIVCFMPKAVHAQSKICIKMENHTGQCVAHFDLCVHTRKCTPIIALLSGSSEHEQTKI